MNRRKEMNLLLCAEHYSAGKTSYQIKLKFFWVLTISKALRVISSIGNNWSLSFIEVSILFSTKRLCEKVGRGGRTLPLGSESFWPGN
jgi:hypothetical protein